MNKIIIVLVVLVLALQVRLWVGEGGVREVMSLQREVRRLEQEIERMTQRNQALRAEVDNLKSGLDAIEERARSELGMLREGETFFQVIEPAAKPAQP